MSDAADLVQEADPALVFECELDAPPARVWRALAEPEIRGAWLGEPDAGPSEVRRADPGERLDLAWPTREGESLISFRIDPAEGGGSHLTITHRAPLTASVLTFTPRARLATACVTRWRIAA
jgi:uncharacterized protein YndB with AHSA1/START domain